MLADPFILVIAGVAFALMLLALGLLKRSGYIGAEEPGSPINLCLKCLNEGHDPKYALEFVADWGPNSSKREFRDYATRLKKGRSLEEVLDLLRAARPSTETELLVACLISQAETARHSAVSSEIVQQTAKRTESTVADLHFIIGGSRRWVIALVWVGLAGGAMLLIAFPVYSQALLQTSIGRCVLVLAVCLQALGLVFAGRLLSLSHRLERKINEP